MIDLAAFAALTVMLIAITVIESIEARSSRLLILLRLAALPLFGFEVFVLASRLSHFR